MVGVRKEVDHALWEIRSKLTEIKSTLETAQFTFLYECAKVLREMKREIEPLHLTEQ